MAKQDKPKQLPKNPIGIVSSARWRKTSNKLWGSWIKNLAKWWITANCWNIPNSAKHGWRHRLTNLVNSRGHIKNPTNTIRFIHNYEVPQKRQHNVTYGSFVCLVRPPKDKPNHTQFTVGSDRINYPGEVATPTADMLVAKILFNSVISTRGARFMTIDIINFYLMTPLKQPEFIRVKFNHLPEEIVNKYKHAQWSTSREWYISKSQKVCTAYLKWDLSQMSSSNNDSTNTVTSKANWYPVSGSTSQGPFPSHSWSTISA